MCNPYAFVRASRVTATAIPQAFRGSYPTKVLWWGWRSVWDTRFHLSHPHLLFTFLLAYGFLADMDTKGKKVLYIQKNKQKKNPISNKTKVFVLGSFPLPAGGNLTNQVWLIIKTRKHLLYLWRIRVPLTPEILKSSRSWTTISRLGSFVSEFLTYRQKKKKKKREGKKYIFSCGIHTHHLHVKLCEHACWKTCKPSTWIMCKSCSVSNALLSLHHVAAHSDASPDIPTTN